MTAPDIERVRSAIERHVAVGKISAGEHLRHQQAARAAYRAVLEDLIRLDIDLDATEILWKARESSKWEAALRHIAARLEGEGDGGR